MNQTAELEVLEVVLSNQVRNSMNKLARIRREIQKLRREETEMENLLRDDQRKLEVVRAGNALNKEIQNTMVYNTLGRRQMF
jgi:hypothetical protein